MLELNRRQREVLVEKLPDVANVAAGALVFGQILGNRPFSFMVAVFGLTAWACLFGSAVLLAKRLDG